MLKSIGSAIKMFAANTGIENINIDATCSGDEIMTSDGRMHDGLSIVFHCDIFDEEDDDE